MVFDCLLIDILSTLPPPRLFAVGAEMYFSKTFDTVLKLIFPSLFVNAPGRALMFIVICNVYKFIAAIIILTGLKCGEQFSVAYVINVPQKLQLLFL